MEAETFRFADFAVQANCSPKCSRPEAFVGIDRLSMFNERS